MELKYNNPQNLVGGFRCVQDNLCDIAGNQPQKRNLTDECKMNYFYNCLPHSTNTHMRFPFYKAVVFVLLFVISCAPKT